MEIKFKIAGSVLLVVVIVAVAGVSPVFAQNQEGRPMMQCKERFDSMDTDNDGIVSKKEFMDFSHRGNRNPENVFDSRDGNNDGELNRDEFCSGDRGMRRKGKRKGKGKNSW